MSKEQQYFIIQVLKFVCVQVIKQHCVFCKFFKKEIESGLLVVVFAICNKIKSTPKFDTSRKRKANRSLMIEQVNLAVDAWIKNAVEYHLKFYQELWADYFAERGPVWYNSKEKLIEIWTSNKSNIVETNIKLLLLPAQNKKKTKMMKKILNRHGGRFVKVVLNNNNNNSNHNQRNLVNKNRNQRNLVNKNRNNHNNR